MIRVVLDTNVVASALRQPLGLPARILGLAYSGAIELSISKDLFAEYQDVLYRPRLKIKPDSAQALLDWCRTHATWIEPTEQVKACADPDDNMVLACAQQAGADFLITGNVIDFPRRWGKTLIVTPRQLVDSITS